MAPIIRIALRWVGGMLVARGWIAQGDDGILDDPDLVAAISYSIAALCALVSEGWYVLERRIGWAK